MKASKGLTVLLFCHSARLAGAQLSLLSLARALDVRDFRVVVVLPEEGELVKLLNASKIPVVYCHYGFSLYTSPIEKLATYPATVSRVLDVITSVQPDVCYVNSGVLLHVVAACLLSLGQRVILRVGAIFEDQTQPFDDHAREEAILYPLCPVIHTPSQWLREWLVMERGVTPAQVVSIPSFGEDDTLPARAPRSPNHFQMLCTLDDNKGPDLFIRAAAQLRALAPRHAVTFQINGDGPEEYRSYLHRLVEEYKLADCFTIGPPVVRVAQLYQRARAVLILSKMEGFGNVASEAAYFGVPVITTQCRGAQEIVDPEQTGLWLETREASEVAGAMLRLLDDEALAQRLGQQAQVVYLQRFAPGVLVPQYIKLFQEVAAGVYPSPRLDILAQQSIWRYLLDMSQRAQDEWANLLAEKEQTVQALSAQVAQGEQAQAALRTQVAEKEQAVAALLGQVAENEQAMQALSAQVAQGEQALAALQAQVAEREQAVQGLSAQVAQRDDAVAALQAQVAAKEQAIRGLSGQLVAKEAQVERITRSLGWKLLSRYGRIKHRYLLPIYRLLGLMPAESTAMDIACTSAISETSATSGSTPEAPPRPLLYDVVVFPIIDWEFRFQRPQQIATRFARAGHRVFYVRTAFREHQTATIQAIGEGVFEVQLPGPSYISLYSHAMDGHLRGTLCDAFASLRQEFGIVEAVCFVNLPFWRPIALTLRDRFGWKVVYDCMDYHGGFSNTADAMLKEEDELSRASDLVLTTSRPLFADQSQRNPNCLLVTNATDFEHFHVACGALPDELRNLGKPIIGYYGAIADWFDSELIHELALARPRWSFVLIGRTFGANLAPFLHSKNVHLLEEKPYSVLPPYLHALDVCIIPFKKTPLTEMTNPVKLFEFLSAGKAIVATDLTELRHYSDYVELASTPAQWLFAIEKALHDHSPERVAARVEFARHNTWDERVAQIKQHVNALFPKASIIVVTYNNLDYTRLCLESIYKRTVYPNYEVIVVDNASTDGTVEFLKTFGTAHSNFAPLFNERNEGFASANNRGIAAAAGEYIIFLNNDTIVTRGWLSGLINHLRDPQVGIVGPVTNSSGNESRIEVDYQTPDEMESFAERYTCAREGQTFKISMLALFCIAMRRSVIIDEVGLLDERFGIGMFEDDDYAVRIKQKGYKVICAEDVFVHHWGRASFSKLSQEEYQRLFDENRRKFEEKWGMQWEPHRSRSGR